MVKKLYSLAYREVFQLNFQYIILQIIYYAKKFSHGVAHCKLLK